MWRCKYGWAAFDECFYLTIPYRLLQSDILFVNEWHLSQLSSVLILPLMFFYLKVFKTTAGVIIIFRYIYTFIHALVTIFIYFKLKKYSRCGAIISSICFFLFSPFSINALSYNSMGIMFLTIFCVLILTNESKKACVYYFSGWFFAGAVLCCPFLLILAVLIFIFVFICKKYKNIKGSTYLTEILDFKAFIFIMAGSFTIAVIFFGYVFSKVPIADFFKSLQYILNDPEHKFISPFKLIVHYIVQFGNHIGNYVYAYFAFIILIIFDKNRKKRKSIYLIICALLNLYIFYSIRSVAINVLYINFFMFPLNILALVCFIIFYDNKIIGRIFATLWVPGMVYTMCIFISSNTGFMAVSAASAVSLTGSLVIIVTTAGLLIKEEKVWFFKMSVISLACLLLFTQIGIESYFNYNYTFNDDLPLKYQNMQIKQGSAKGIYVSQEKYELYDSLFKSEKEIRSKYSDKKNILFFTRVTWLGLDMEEYRSATFSAWLSGITDITVERLDEYYSVCPDKLPDIIFTPPENDSYAQKIAELTGEYNKETLNTGDFIYVRSS